MLSVEAVNNAARRHMAAGTQGATDTPSGLSVNAVYRAAQRYDSHAKQSAPKTYGQGNIDLRTDMDAFQSRSRDSYLIYDDPRSKETVVIPKVRRDGLALTAMGDEEAINTYRQSGKYYIKYAGVNMFDPGNTFQEKLERTTARNHQQAEAYIQQLMTRIGAESSSAQRLEQTAEKLNAIQRERLENVARKMYGNASDTVAGSLGLAALNGLHQFASGISNMTTGGRSNTNILDDAFQTVAAEERAELSGGMQVAYDIVNNIAANAVPMTVGAVTGMPLLASAFTFAQTYGNDMKYAVQAGYDNKKAFTYAFLDGLNQGFLDLALSSLPGLGTLGKSAKAAISRNVSNAVLRFLALSGVDTAGEVATETLQIAIENGLRNAVLGEKRDAGRFSEEVLYFGMVSALTSLLLNTPGNLSQSRKGGAGEAKTGVQAEMKTDSGKKPYISIEEFANSESAIWKNVDYNDTATKLSVMQETHDSMVADGAVVKVSDAVQEQVDGSFPDLRGMKKKERVPLLKEAMSKVKENLRQFLSGFKGTRFEFDVNGKVLEARLYSTGINEVLEKVTQEKASMLYTTKDIFQNARYLYSTTDYDGDPNIYRWNYFYTPVQIGENIVGVRIAVRDMAKQGESQIYNWGIKKDISLGGVGDDSTNRRSHGASSDMSNDSIPDSQAIVKDGEGENRPIGENIVMVDKANAQSDAQHPESRKQTKAYEAILGVEVATSVGEAIGRINRDFGNLSENGVLQGIEASSDLSTSYAKYLPQERVIILNPAIKQKNAMEILAQDAAWEYEHGGWSTKHPFHSVYHELGHALQRMVYSRNPSVRSRIEDLYSKTYRSIIGEGVVWVFEGEALPMLAKKAKEAGFSYYGLKNPKEFVSEAIAQYYCSDTPCEITNEIMTILMEG